MWSESVIEAMGFPQGLFMPIDEPGTIRGVISQSIQDELHLGPVPVVAVASHDTGSAIAAVPAEDDSFAYISSGTWSLMGIESHSPVMTPKSRELNFTNEGGVEGTWRILKNIMGLWLVQECRRSWADTGAAFSDKALLSLAISSKHFKKNIG